MDTLFKILVVEDEMIVGAKIAMQLTNLGYEVTGILSNGLEALASVENKKPDIVLLDINLKGGGDGIEIAKQIQQMSNIPIIYLTANSDEATFNRAKATKPAAFISKPFKQLDLQRAIELSISRMNENDNHDNHNNHVALNNNTPELKPFILNDCIFVRSFEKMVKVPLKCILYIEAERNYCRIYSIEKEYLVVITLKEIEDKLPANYFLRVHRSFIVNISHIDEIAASHVMIANKPIPLSADLKKNLLLRIQKL